MRSIMSSESPTPSSSSSSKKSRIRTLSASNVDLTHRCKSHVRNSCIREAQNGGTLYFRDTPKLTLMLPPSEGATKNKIHEILVNRIALDMLQNERVINWSNSVTALLPINTISDSNCLLHAASLGMWGFQDRDHILRNALHEAISNQGVGTLYERWKYCRNAENFEVGLVLEEPSWLMEWEVVNRQTMPGVDGGLDDFHLFVLANILRRPIVLYASDKFLSVSGGDYLQNLNFSGLYLPLLCQPSLCMKTPLPMAYCNGHFTALAVLESDEKQGHGKLVLPIVYANNSPFSVKFTLPNENTHRLCDDYLDLIEVRNSQATPAVIKCCTLDLSRNSASSFPGGLMASFLKAHDLFPHGSRSVALTYQEPPAETDTPSFNLLQQVQGVMMKCKQDGCHFFGSKERLFYCSQCYKKLEKKPADPIKPLEPLKQVEPIKPAEPIQQANPVVEPTVQSSNPTMPLFSMPDAPFEIFTPQAPPQRTNCVSCRRPCDTESQCRRCILSSLAGDECFMCRGISVDSSDCPVFLLCKSHASEFEKHKRRGSTQNPPTANYPKNTLPGSRLLCCVPGCSQYREDNSGGYCKFCYDDKKGSSRINTVGAGLASGSGGATAEGDGASVWDGAEAAGSVGASGGSEKAQVMDKLCKAPGCSYYCYADLQFYCPYCYEETTKVEVDFEKYPAI